MKFKYLLASSVVCAAAATVNAAEVADWGELTPDEVYYYDAMVPIQGVFTPSETGVIRCYSSGDLISPYAEPTHDTPIQPTNGYYGADGVKVRFYDVVAGVPLYFYDFCPLDAGTFRISTGIEPIELVDVTPAEDVSNLSLSTNYNASITFNIPIKCTKCVLSINDASVELNPTITDSYINIYWSNTILNWYHEGKISEGDILTLTLTGIRDAYNSSNRPDFGYGVGKLILKYKMADKPAELINEYGTPASGVSDFLTYYLPGSGEGLVKLTFSGDLDKDCHPIAELTYGDPDNIEMGMYIENPPVSVDGKTVTVDLQGKTRFPDEMIPGLPVQSNIGLRIYGIKSADGQYVLTGYSSSPYSFGYSYNLKSVVYSLAADWVPAAGSALNAGEPMEIWVLNGQKIKFDSVDFSYVKNGVDAIISVPYSDLTVTEDSADAMLYNFTAPAIDADPDSDIEVTLGGLKCADGLDHNSDIFVRYKASTAAVDGIQIEEGEAVYYDLTGRRVASPSKGIYIVNGKKIVVK